MNDNPFPGSRVCRGCRRNVLQCMCGHEKVGEAQHEDYWTDRYKFLSHRAVGRLEYTDDDLRADTEDKVARFVRHMPPPPASVFEYGAGWGRFVEVLIAAGYDARGVDIAPSAVALARDRGLPVTQLPLDPHLVEPADVVMTSVCLQHVPDGDQLDHAVAVIRAALRPGGRLILYENTSTHLEEPHPYLNFRSADEYAALFPWLNEQAREVVESEHGEVHTLLVLA